MTDKSKITVVSLGPGPREYLTLGAIDALKKAEWVILRTSLRCDAADYLREMRKNRCATGYSTRRRMKPWPRCGRRPRRLW